MLQRWSGSNDIFQLSCYKTDSYLSVFLVLDEKWIKCSRNNTSKASIWTQFSFLSDASNQDLLLRLEISMKELRFAIRNTIPIFFTYLFIGIAFGNLMSDAGYGVLLSMASAFFIFAGSMQLVMVPMMTSGASLFLLALMSLFINLSVIA